MYHRGYSEVLAASGLTIIPDRRLAEAAWRRDEIRGQKKAGLNVTKNDVPNRRPA